MQIFNAVKAYESAGAFGAEIEVVPSEVATEISKRTTLFMVSMGAGTGCDAQYLFAEDVLGSNTGHYPGMPSATAILPRRMPACKRSALRHLRSLPGM